MSMSMLGKCAIDSTFSNHVAPKKNHATVCFNKNRHEQYGGNPPHDTMLTPHALHIARAALQTMPTKRIVELHIGKLASTYSTCSTRKGAQGVHSHKF